MLHQYFLSIPFIFPGWILMELKNLLVISTTFFPIKLKGPPWTWIRSNKATQYSKTSVRQSTLRKFKYPPQNPVLQH